MLHQENITSNNSPEKVLYIFIYIRFTHVAPHSAKGIWFARDSEGRRKRKNVIGLVMNVGRDEGGIHKFALSKGGMFRESSVRVYYTLHAREIQIRLVQVDSK